MTPIPKTIHYCWFGGAKLPEIARQCIASWRTHCGDYSITEWNESNFDIAGAPLYVRQAHEARRWAFVSDYVRLSVLHEYGGIYMDTDLEVIRPIDRFLEHRAFSSFQDEESIPTAIMGSEAGNRWIGALLHDYDGREFLRPDGSYDLTTNVELITDLTVRDYGLIRDNSCQELADGVVIYPNRYFCPKVYETQEVEITDDTYTIHHFNASWYDPAKLRAYRLHQALSATYRSYDAGEWKMAYQNALASLRTSPALALNRGIWSVMIKSVWRYWCGRGR